MKLLIDSNSYLNMALLRGTDHDGGRVVKDEKGKDVQVNSADYGVEGFWDKVSKDLDTFAVAPRQVSLIWDGANAKNTRRTFLPTYKEGRDKLAEVSEQLNIARDRVTEMALKLGMRVIQQKSYEADDVLAYLVKHLRDEPNTICTSDGDLSVLVDDNTHVWRLGELDKNPCGPFPHKYIRLYKALVGDTSDKIPGAKGFGDSKTAADPAWVKLVRTFGFEGLDELIKLIENGTLHTLAEDVADLPVLQKIIDAKDMVATSWRVAGLMTDQINTMRKPWDLRAGMVAQWDELPDDLRVHELRRFYGTKTLVTADNYERISQRFAVAVHESPFVALDIETSSSEDSDEWIERVKALTENGKERVDVLGHELTGMSLTFGANTQHTFYMSVDHFDTNNITVDQCREMVEQIPQRLHTVIQNRQFEFSVLYRTWGDKWANNGWHGFVPNALDTMIGASYTNENIPKGLKGRSLHHLGYKQSTYAETTTKSGPVGSMSGGQRSKVFKQEVAPSVYKEQVITINDEWVDDDGEIHQSVSEQVTQELATPAVFEEWESRQYKMRELTGIEVLNYGCDDTLVTAALHTHYQFVMETESTWQTYLAVETLPEYLTSLAFVQGLRVSLSTLKKMEDTDEVSFNESWKELREFLMHAGWEGTSRPEFEGSIEPSDVRIALPIILGGEFSTKKRKLVGIALDVREQFPDNGKADVLATIIERDDVEALNRMVKDNFTGEPNINFGSPKQMQNLFYRVLKLPVRILNKLTEKQRDDQTLQSAFKKHRLQREGRDVKFSEEETEALISKASTDDLAADTALAAGNLGADVVGILKAYKEIKEIKTRRSLFYKPYKALPHWRDGRIHPSLQQSETHTRRHTAGSPNIQQVSSGTDLRKFFLAHHDDAVFVSLDFSSQEAAIAAELSQDPAMVSCFVGDNLRDMHSLTAVNASKMVWGEAVSYEDFQKMRKSEDPVVKARAGKLRDQGKRTNFAALFGSGAKTVSEGLMISEELAQSLLDARATAFARFIEWEKEVKELAGTRGYTTTMMGARRHLAQDIMSDNKYDRARAERQGLNAMVQSTAAEQLKLAMARVWASGVCTGRYDGRFMFPVHDELCFSINKDQAVEFILEAHACMVAPYADMKIPMNSSVAIGKTFATEVEVGTSPTRENIEAAIAKVFGSST